MKNPENKFGFRFYATAEGYGVNYSNKDIIRVLDHFGVENSDEYLMPSSGVFYALPGEYHLRWEIKADSSILSLPEIDLSNLSMNINFGMKRVEVFPGETRCDDTCIFFGSCDGERGSFFNPSTRLFPCDKYDLNKYTIRKNTIGLL